MELHSICSRKAKPSDGSFRVFNDHKDMVRSDLDAVIIATPTGTHFEIAMDAIEAGKHVLVEKPMAVNSEQCRKMIDSSRKNSVKLMVAQTLRYNPTIIKLKQMMKDHGPIKSISMEQHLEPPDREWLYNKDMAGGGVLLNTGVHIFDTIRSLTDSNIVPRSCKIDNILNKHLDDVAFGSFVLSNGIEGTFSTSRYHQARRREITLKFKECEIFADAMRDFIILKEKNDINFVKVTGEKRAIVPLLEDLRDSILKNRPPSISGKEGLEAVKTCNEFYNLS